MERMLVVVLSDESKAYEASRALNQLDAEGSITVHGESVITKNNDGTVTEHVADGDFLRNPADTRDWNDSPREAGERRGTSDRFVLRFVKP